MPSCTARCSTTDHITTARLALAQLPKRYRRGRRTLIHTDSAGGTHDFVSWLVRRGRWLSYSVGMTVTEAIHEHVWTMTDVDGYRHFSRKSGR